jgi:hypothetical protein
MRLIFIPVRDLHANQTVEIEVTIDGRKSALDYRIETVPRSDDNGMDDQIELLRTFIRDHDPAWEMVQMGQADSGVVATTFRQITAEHPTALS